MELLVQHYVHNVCGDSSILDSGYAKHLSAESLVTDADNVTMLTGFDGSTQWTQGNGYLPLHVVDEYTGDRIPLDNHQILNEKQHQILNQKKSKLK